MFEIDSKIPILIISADPDITLNCKVTLKKSGFANVETIESGVEALKLCESKKFEVVFCNQNTKHLAGWLFVEEFKNSPKISNAVMILMGLTPSPASLEKLKQYGLPPFLEIPFSNKQMMEALTSSLSEFYKPATIEGKYSVAKEALIAKNTEVAIEKYLELHFETDASVRSMVGLINSYEIQNNRAKVSELARSINMDAADSPSVSMAVLRSYCLDEKFEKCEGVVDKILDMTKDTSVYFIASLNLMNAHKQYELAGKIGLRAKKCGHNGMDFCVAVARDLFLKSKVSESLEIIKKAEKDFGKSLEGLNLKGVCLRHLKDYEASRKCYELALKISPMDAKIYFNLALSEVLLENTEVAVRHLETCLKIAPDFDKAKLKLAELNRQLIESA